MSEPTLEQLRATFQEIKTLFSVWQYRLRMQDFEIFLTPIYEEDAEWPTTTAMGTSTDWAYGTASLGIHLHNLAHCDRDELEEMVVHELTHVMLSELVEQHEADDFQCHKERVTVRVARAMLWLNYGDGLKRRGVMEREVAE